MSARETALKILYAVEYDGAYPNIALKDALAENKSLSAKDKGLITELVYGIIDKKLTLDYVIGRYSRVKLKKISKYILLILRMGLYQLMFTDKIPESAAVNESVKLAKRYGHGASAGFVNGVLRSFIRGGVEYPEKGVEYLSVKYSFPIWLCERWVSDFGFEFTEDLLKAFGEDAKITLRPNSMKITAEGLSEKLRENGVEAETSDGVVICGGFDIASDALYREGFYTPQDKAAMRSAEVLAPRAGETVIDMCAAPGGKTTHMAELMENSGEILAFDIHEHKIRLIEDNAARLGIDIIKASIGDGTVFDPALEGKADKVLCDAPCSGLGVIRRKPDIKWNKQPESDLPELQRKILENGARYLKRGGEIVYSTCTIEKEENEEVIDAFLSENADFEKLYEKTFYPNTDGTDGFYICKLRKI